jgi:hypothetical protein
MVNNWENGTPVGGFDTVEEAEAYTLENGLDVTIFNYTTLNGTGYRFNADINARREATGTLDPIVDGQHRTEYDSEEGRK